MSLEEHEIRPDHLKKDQAALFAADIARLLARKREFVEAPCPACGSSRSALAFVKCELDYRTCLECETVFVSPRPSPAVLEYYYQSSENYQYWNTHIFPASEEARRAKIFRPRAERLVAICRTHGVHLGTLLEVGAGFGTFCEEIRRLGAFERVLAVEPTPDLAATCRRKGLDVIDKPIEQVSLGAHAADVIASFEVIEHLFSPRQFLESCHGLLKPGGVVLLTCPNAKGFDVALLGAASDTFDVEHLNYFHPASLSALLTRTGFEVLETLTPGELDAELARKKILAGALDVSAQPFVKRVLVDEFDRLGGPFQRFLAGHGLSSHMWIVARKPDGT